MTEEQIVKWKAKRDEARNHPDPAVREALLKQAYDDRDDLLMECVSHQAIRVKKSLENDERIEKKLDNLDDRLVKVEEDMKPVKESDKDYRAQKERIQGAKMLWQLLRYLAAAGAGGAVAKLLLGGQQAAQAVM